MNSVKRLIDLSARREGPATFETGVPLPLRATDLDAAMAGLLHDALHGARSADLHNALCKHLARILRLRLALLLRSVPSGSFAMVGTSAENSLWLELQRIPERWDDGLSSRGPAGEALRAKRPIHMRIDDDGFALWRRGAESECVRQILALPVPVSDGDRIVELHFDGEIARGASIGTLTAAQLIHRIETFLADLQTIERQRLLSRALTSAGNAALITDLEGTIVWSNPAFSTLSGYAAEEVVGRNPSLLHSGQQGVRYYRELWGTIRAGHVWTAETVDRGKDGDTYTIRQTVSPVSEDGRITHYLSLQQDVGREKKARVALERATQIFPGTHLLTPAAFEDAARRIVSAAGHEPCALVLVSLRGLQRAASAMGEDMDALVSIEMGQRVGKAFSPPDLAGISGAYEYALLLRSDVSDASIRARLAALIEQLREPLPYIGVPPALDVHYGLAVAQPSGSTLEEMRLRADRLLANEPYRRAQRDVRGSGGGDA